MDCNAKSFCGGNQPSIIACQFDIFAACTQEYDSGEVQSVKRTDSDWKWAKRSAQDLLRQIDQRYSAQKAVRCISMRLREAARMNTVPHFVLKQPT